MDTDLERDRFVYRCFVKAFLAWDIDPTKAKHNPVFEHNGRMNYHFSDSLYEHACYLLLEQGILESGFNGAHQLTAPFNKIESAADASFDRGVNMAKVVHFIREWRDWHWFSIDFYEKLAQTSAGRERLKFFPSLEELEKLDLALSEFE